MLRTAVWQEDAGSCQEKFGQAWPVGRLAGPTPHGPRFRCKGLAHGITKAAGLP
jgi:hypothetical protein